MKIIIPLIYLFFLLLIACNKEEIETEIITSDTTIYDDDKNPWGFYDSFCNCIFRNIRFSKANKFIKRNWFDKSKLIGMSISEIDTALSMSHERIGYMIDVSYLGTLTGIMLYYKNSDSLYNVAIICIKPGYRNKAVYKLSGEHVYANLLPPYKYKNYELMKNIRKVEVHQYQTTMFYEIGILDSLSNE